MDSGIKNQLDRIMRHVFEMLQQVAATRSSLKNLQEDVSELRAKVGALQDGQEKTQAEMAQMRLHSDAQAAALRRDMGAMDALVREEASSLATTLRAEMNTHTDALRAEINALAAETRQGFAACNEELATLRQEIRAGWQEFLYQEHNLSVRVNILEKQVGKLLGKPPTEIPAP